MAKTTMVKYKCPICDRNIESTRNYYKSSNKKHKETGHVDVCKVCAKEYFSNAYKKTGDTRKAIIATMAYLDLPFDNRNVSEFNENEVLSIDDAFSLFNSFITTNLGVGQKLLTRDDFDYVGLVDLAYPNSNLVIDEETGKSEEKLYIKSDKYDLEITDDVILFFGEGFTESQYKTLLREYLKFARSFSTTNSVDELNFKEVAYFSLKIAEAKSSGVSEKEIIALVDARRKLLADANVQNKKEENEAVMAMGSLVKKMEFSRPASDPLPEWDDNKLHQLEVTIAGHLMSSKGIENELTKEYEELVEPYGIEGSLEDQGVE